MREPVRAVMRDHAAGQREGLRHIAVGERRDEGAVGKIRVFGIVAQRLAEEGRGGERVALRAGDDRGEIIARQAGADLERPRDDDIFPRREAAVAGEPEGARIPQARCTTGAPERVSRGWPETQTEELSWALALP